MLRTVVSDLTGILPAAVPLCAICPDCGGEHGQPRLDAASEPCLHLSLTHGHDVVVAAAHWNSPVGIDLESGNQSAAALAAIEKLTGEQSVLRWTRVEAILKADGRGLRVDPAHVVLQEIPGSDGDSWIEGAVAGSPTRYLVSETTLQPDIRVSVAVAILPNR
jgi:4'-phosphopantetheinyl transferase